MQLPDARNMYRNSCSQLCEPIATKLPQEASRMHACHHPTPMMFRPRGGKADMIVKPGSQEWGYHLLL